MTFGDNLKTLRTSRSISQKALADELGFSFQNVSKWERNESLPDIETLLAIAKFFGTTTDALLSYTTEEQYSTLKISGEEVKVYDSYPEKDETIKKMLLIGVDSESKITTILYIPPLRAYRTGYLREGYEPLDENSTIMYEYAYRFLNRECKEREIEHKRIRIPNGGFLISLPNAAFAAKKIMQFVIPDEYSAWLDPDSHAGYYNNRNNRFLLGDILRHGELDAVTVERTKDGILFKKPCEAVDPMVVNIETLAKIVRKELEKEHDKKIEELKKQIEELSDTVEELEERIEDLES